MFRRKPKKIKDILGQEFDVSKMGPNLKRGMVLRIYRSKVVEAAGETVARQIKHVKLKGKHDNPDLYIYCDHHTAAAFINMYRYQILQKINERMKGPFIKSIRVR